jgi:hypothetical protein
LAPAAAPSVPFDFERASRREEAYALALSEAMLAGVSVDEGSIAAVAKATKARFKDEPEAGDTSGLFKPEAFFLPFSKVIVKLAKDVDRLMRDMGLENYAIQVAQKAQIEFKASASVFMERMKSATEEKMRSEGDTFDARAFDNRMKNNGIANVPYQLQKARLAMLYMQYMFDETIQVNRYHNLMYRDMVSAGVLKKSINNQVRMAELYDAVNRWVDLAANMEKAILMQNAKPVLDPIPMRVSALPAAWLDDPFFVQPIDESNPIKARITNPTASESKRHIDSESNLIRRYHQLKNEGLLYDQSKGMQTLQLLFKLTRQLLDRNRLFHETTNARISASDTTKRIRTISKFCERSLVMVDLDAEETQLINLMISCIKDGKYGDGLNDNILDIDHKCLFVPARLPDHRMFWMNLGCKDVLEWVVDNRLIETSKAMSKLLPEFGSAFRPLLTKLRLKEQAQRAETARRKRAMRDKTFSLFAIVVRSAGLDAVGSKIASMAPNVGKVSSVRFV